MLFFWSKQLISFCTNTTFWKQQCDFCLLIWWSRSHYHVRRQNFNQMDLCASRYCHGLPGLSEFFYSYSFQYNTSLHLFLTASHATDDWSKIYKAINNLHLLINLRIIGFGLPPSNIMHLVLYLSLTVHLSLDWLSNSWKKLYQLIFAACNDDSIVSKMLGIDLSSIN